MAQSSLNHMPSHVRAPVCVPITVEAPPPQTSEIIELVDEGTSWRFGTYLGNFFHFKLAELSQKLAAAGLVVEEYALKGRVVPVIAGILPAPEQFNDFDIQIRLRSQAPDGCIDDNTAKVIHKICRKTFKPLKDNFNPKLPFVNYKLKPLRSDSQQTPVKSLDVTLFMKRSGIPPISEPDATSSRDGFKLIVVPNANGPLRFFLTQSAHVSAYSTLLESCDLLKRNRYKVSLEHAREVRDGLLIYLRNFVLGYIYINEMNEPGNIDHLFQLCSETFYTQYSSKAPEMQLGDRLKTFICNHFPDDQENTILFLTHFVHIIKTTAVHQPHLVRDAIQFLYNTQSCAKRLGLLNRSPKLNECIEKAIQELDIGERKEREEDGLPLLPIVNRSMTPSASPSPTCNEVAQGPEEVEEESESPTPSTAIIEPLPEEEAAIPDPVVPAKAPYTLQQYIEDPSTLPGTNRIQKADCLTRLLNRTQPLHFDDSSLLKLEQNLDAQLSDLESNHEDYFALSIAYLNFRNQSTFTKAQTLVANGISAALCQQSRKKGKKGKKNAPEACIDNYIQTYKNFTVTIKMGLLPAICLSPLLNTDAISENNAAQLLEWIATDSITVSPELWIKAQALLKRIDSKKQDKLTPRILHKTDPATKAAHMRQLQANEPKPVEPEPIAEVTPTTPLPIVEETPSHDQRKQELLAIISLHFKSADMAIQNKNWIDALYCLKTIQDILYHTPRKQHPGKETEGSLQTKLEHIRFQCNQYLLSIPDEDKYVVMIDFYERYHLAGGLDLDAAVYKSLVCAYAIKGQYPIAICHTLKATQLLENLSLNDTIKNSVVLGNLLTCLHNAVQKSPVWSAPVKTMVAKIPRELSLYRRKKRPYDFNKAIRELEAVYEKNPPLQKPTPANSTQCVALGDCFVSDTTSSDAFLLALRALHLETSDLAMGFLCKLGTSHQASESVLMAFNMFRKNGNKTLMFSTPEIYSYLAIFSKQRFDKKGNWTDLGYAYLFTLAAQYCTLKADRPGASVPLAELLNKFSDLNTAMKKQIAKKVVPQEVIDAIAHCNKTVAKYHPDQHAIWVQAIEELSDLLLAQNSFETPKNNPPQASIHEKELNKIDALINKKNWLQALKSLKSFRSQADIPEDMQEAINEKMVRIQTLACAYLNSHISITNRFAVFKSYHQYEGLDLDEETYKYYQHKYDQIGEWPTSYWCCLKRLHLKNGVQQGQMASAMTIVEKTNFLIFLNRSIQQSNRWSQAIKEEIQRITDKNTPNYLFELFQHRLMNPAAHIEDPTVDIEPLRKIAFKAIKSENPAILPIPTNNNEVNSHLEKVATMDIADRYIQFYHTAAALYTSSIPGESFLYWVKTSEIHLTEGSFEALAVSATVSKHQEQFIRLYTRVLQEKFNMDAFIRPSLLYAIANIYTQHYLNSSHNWIDMLQAYAHSAKALIAINHGKQPLKTPNDLEIFTNHFHGSYQMLMGYEPLKNEHPELLSLITELVTLVNPGTNEQAWQAHSHLKKIEVAIKDLSI